MGSFLIKIIHFLYLNNGHARVELACFFYTSVWVFLLGGKTELLNIAVWVFNSSGAANVTGGVAIDHLLERELNVSSCSDTVGH